MLIYSVFRIRGQLQFLILSTFCITVDGADNLIIVARKSLSDIKECTYKTSIKAWLNNCLQSFIWVSKYTREKLSLEPDLIQETESKNRHAKGPDQFGQTLPKLSVTNFPLFNWLTLTFHCSCSDQHLCHQIPIWKYYAGLIRKSNW